MNVNMIIKKIVLFLVAISVIQGCATTSPLFYWGEYEQLVYDMYMKPGNAPPIVQIEKLTADIRKAQSRGLPVAPGVYAHLGFMHATEGNVSDAEAAFSQEMALFPESQVLIQAMLDRARKSADQKGAL